MCESKCITYTCGCTKEMEFVQCQERRGTIVKCHPATKTPDKVSTNYCPGHLVKPNAPLAKLNQQGGTVDE